MNQHDHLQESLADAADRTTTRKAIPIECELINANQLAIMLGISERTVYRLKSTGQLPAPIVLCSCVRWRLQEIRKWIEDGCLVPLPNAQQEHSLMQPNTSIDPDGYDGSQLLLTSREAASRLRISERTLWTLTDCGHIRCIRIGTAKRYPIGELEQFVAKQLLEQNGPAANP